MQDKLQEQLKQFLGYIIWDCFHNDIKVDDSACNGVTNYIFNGVGGDNKLFEIWLERFNELIDQNFIGKEVWKEKINSRMILQLCEHDFDDEDEEDEVARKRQNKLLEDLLEQLK